MEKKISIIIPAYNVENYINKCLLSIFEQTYMDFEVIIINDGSTDGTGDICDDWAKKDERFKVIHKHNEGVSIARNVGISEARGKFILFYDGDDFIEPDTFACLIEMMEAHNTDLLVYGYHRYQDNKTIKTCVPIFEQGIYKDQQIMSNLFPYFIGISSDGVNRWLSGDNQGLYRENAALWRTMLRKDIIDQNQLKFNPKLRIGEDTLFMSEYLSYSQSCYVTHRCFYYLVIRPTSTIYQYERNPFAKVEEKSKLIEARQGLTNRILEREGLDVSRHWSGTVIMSCLELAFLLSKPHPDYTYQQRYRKFLDFMSIPYVEKVVGKYKPKMTVSVKLIPMLLLSFNLRFLLFFATRLLHVIKYEFVREL